MPITVVLELNLKADRVDAVLAGLKEILPDTRAFDGCLSVSVVRDADDRSHVALIERWAQRSDQERYFAWRQETGSLAAQADDAAGPPRVTYYEERPEI
jgi:quinol monooxygenase YgiN